MGDFEPRILAFACNWCSYAGADLAGVSRIQYPPNIRIIRVMCSGRVDPTFVLDALAKGVDGVMVLGCHPGDCHYISGNLMAEKKIRWTRELLIKSGVNPDRLKLEWISASEGERFARTTREFTEQVRKLGPISQEREGILQDLRAARNSAAASRIRILVGKENVLCEEGNVYGDKMSQEEFDSFMNSVLEDEVVRERIMVLTKDEALSVKEIAKRMELTSQDVGRHVMWLRQRGKMALARIEGRSPLYVSVGGGP
ncbi:MAG: hydrogenase iron-sulfur subunit [Thermoplasmata archaeon]|nr:MAG: hydrogenase iron-sulfur subunit [Thermoplasmata archaeon]